jgi:hypothetical protein
VANGMVHTRVRISRKATAQGIIQDKNSNKINAKSGLCPPLCHDPLRPGFFDKFSVEAPLMHVVLGPHSGLPSLSISALASAVAFSMA